MTDDRAIPHRPVDSLDAFVRSIAEIGVRVATGLSIETARASSAVPTGRRRERRESDGQLPGELRTFSGIREKVHRSTSGHQSGTHRLITDGGREVGRGIFDATAVPLLVCDPASGRIREANSAAVSLMGYAREDLVHLTLGDLSASSSAKEARIDAMLARARRGEELSFEWEVASPTGATTWVDAGFRQTTFEGTSMIVATLQDISGRKATSAERREQSAFTRSVINSLPFAFCILDSSGTILRWNDQLQERTGYTDTELHGMAGVSLVVDEGEVELSEAIASAFETRTVSTCEVALETRAGQRVPYRFNLAPVSAPDDTLLGVVISGHDLTDEHLRREWLSVLARVLRHNLRNDMNVIAGYAEHARELSTEADVVEALDRVLETTSDLLGTSEKAREIEKLIDVGAQPRVHVLADVVEGALDRLRPSVAARADIEVSIDPQSRVWTVPGMEDALVEVITNAVEHTEASRVRVRITGTTLPSGAWTVLSVADDGPGIPERERAVLVDGETPLEHGSGLGLWFVNWATRVSGGTLEFAESSMGGSSVDFHLQRVSEDSTDH